MDVREALYTTRAMRRVKPDPVPQDVVARILDAAVRAPSGGNAQSWKFLVIDDKAVIEKLAPVFKDAIGQLFGTIYKDIIDAAAADPESPENAQWIKIQKSAQWLADNFAQVPLLVSGFGDPGSVYPALWNAQLAARADGVGSAMTSVMTFFNREQALEVMGVPADGAGYQATITFGYPLGKWGVAKRNPVESVTYHNQWGEPLGFDVGGPLL